jgi:hypothetical protein
MSASLNFLLIYHLFVMVDKWEVSCLFVMDIWQQYPNFSSPKKPLSMEMFTGMSKLVARTTVHLVLNDCQEKFIC